MHSLSAWTFPGVAGFALAASSIACSPSTNGYGGDDIAYDGESEESDGGLDDEPSGGAEADTNANPMDDGDGEAEQQCEDPQVDDPVEIQLLSNDLEQGDCSEPSFRGRVAVADVGTYGLFACNCEEDPQCEGEKFELTLALPDPEWLPKLEVGSCEYFHIYSEEIEGGVCRRNRVDVSKTKLDTPWYSVGSASEDLDHNGLVVTPVESDACADECGEWQLRDVIFTAKDTEQTLSWGQVAPVGTFEIVNWRSYVTPSGCGAPSVDVTAWTAH